MLRVNGKGNRTQSKNGMAFMAATDTTDNRARNAPNGNAAPVAIANTQYGETLYKSKTSVALAPNLHQPLKERRLLYLRSFSVYLLWTKQIIIQGANSNDLN
jgi:hypothetical protein